MSKITDKKRNYYLQEETDIADNMRKKLQKIRELYYRQEMRHVTDKQREKKEADKLPDEHLNAKSNLVSHDCFPRLPQRKCLSCRQPASVIRIRFIFLVILLDIREFLSSVVVVAAVVMRSDVGRATATSQTFTYRLHVSCQMSSPFILRADFLSVLNELWHANFATVNVH